MAVAKGLVDFSLGTDTAGSGRVPAAFNNLIGVKPSRGLITVFGRDAATLSRNELPEVRRRIGVVFQDFRLLDHLTTFENVALPLRVLGKEEASYRADVIELLRWVGLGDRMHAFPPVLSGSSAK